VIPSTSHTLNYYTHNTVVWTCSRKREIQINLRRVGSDVLGTLWLLTPSHRRPCTWAAFTTLHTLTPTAPDINTETFSRRHSPPPFLDLLSELRFLRMLFFQFVGKMILSKCVFCEWNLSKGCQGLPLVTFCSCDVTRTPWRQRSLPRWNSKPAFCLNFNVIKQNEIVLETAMSLSLLLYLYGFIWKGSMWDLQLPNVP